MESLIPNEVQVSAGAACENRLWILLHLAYCSYLGVPTGGWVYITDYIPHALSWSFE